VHLLDAFLFVQTERVSCFEQRGVALDVLKRLAVAVQQGVSERHLQRLPHGELIYSVVILMRDMCSICEE
jgi:hypothetical protein